MGWFLYDNVPRHERVKSFFKLNISKKRHKDKKDIPNPVYMPGSKFARLL